MMNRWRVRFSGFERPLIKLIVDNSTRLASDVTRSRVTEIAADGEPGADANRSGSDLGIIWPLTSVSIFVDYTPAVRIHFARDGDLLLGIHSKTAFSTTSQGIWTMRPGGGSFGGASLPSVFGSSMVITAASHALSSCAK